MQRSPAISAVILLALFLASGCGPRVSGLWHKHRISRARVHSLDSVMQGDRPVLCYTELDSNRKAELRFAFADNDEPDESLDWRGHRMTSDIHIISDCQVVTAGDRPVIIHTSSNQQIHVRHGQKPFPESSFDWESYSIDHADEQLMFGSEFEAEVGPDGRVFVVYDKGDKFKLAYSGEPGVPESADGWRFSTVVESSESPMRPSLAVLPGGRPVVLYHLIDTSAMMGRARKNSSGGSGKSGTGSNSVSGYQKLAEKMGQTPGSSDSSSPELSAEMSAVKLAVAKNSTPGSGSDWERFTLPASTYALAGDLAVRDGELSVLASTRKGYELVSVGGDRVSPGADWNNLSMSAQHQGHPRLAVRNGRLVAANYTMGTPPGDGSYSPKDKWPGFGIHYSELDSGGESVDREWVDDTRAITPRTTPPVEVLADGRPILFYVYRKNKYTGAKKQGLVAAVRGK